MNRTLVLFELPIITTFILFIMFLPSPTNNESKKGGFINHFRYDAPSISNLSESNQLRFEINFIDESEPVKRVYLKFTRDRHYIDLLYIEAKLTNISSDTLTIARFRHVRSNVISTIYLAENNFPEVNLIINPLWAGQNLRKILLPPNTTIVDTFDVFRADALVLQPNNIYSVSAQYIYVNYREDLKKENDDDYWSHEARSNTLQFTQP